VLAQLFNGCAERLTKRVYLKARKLKLKNYTFHVNKLLVKINRHFVPATEISFFTFKIKIQK